MVTLIDKEDDILIDDICPICMDIMIDGECWTCGYDETKDEI